MRTSVCVVLVSMVAAGLSLVAAAASEAAFGKLTGANAITLALPDLSFSGVSLTDALSVFYRMGSSTLGAQILLGAGGLLSQRFSLFTPLGPIDARGAASFFANAFRAGSLVLSGRFDGGVVAVSGLVSKLSPHQTPSYGFGTTLRVTGSAPGLGRVAFVLGVGATPFGQVMPGFCFEGARVSWTDLSFCGGTATFDFTLDKLVGLSSEYVSWTLPIPFCDFRFHLSLFYEGLLEFQGFHAAVAGSRGDARLSVDWSFDPSLVFTSGSSQVSGPFLGGTLYGTVTLDDAGLQDIAATWILSTETAELVLSPELDVAAAAGSINVEIPSLRVELRQDLTCCQGLSLGQASLGFTLTRTDFEAISVTFSRAF